MIKSILHEGEKLKKALKIGRLVALAGAGAYAGHKFYNSEAGQNILRKIGVLPGEKAETEYASPRDLREC